MVENIVPNSSADTTLWVFSGAAKCWAKTCANTSWWTFLLINTKNLLGPEYWGSPGNTLQYTIFPASHRSCSEPFRSCVPTQLYITGQSSTRCLSLYRNCFLLTASISFDLKVHNHNCFLRSVHPRIAFGIHKFNPVYSKVMQNQLFNRFVDIAF